MLDDSDEESKSNLIAQALPVAQISSKNIDFSLPPATGEEYLLRVRHEASKNPIVVADVNLKKYEPKRTAQFYQEDEYQDDRLEFKPSKEWQLKKAAEFSSLRMRIVKEKEKFIKTISKDKKMSLPKTKSKKEWHAFCFGKVKGSAVENEGKQPLLSILYQMNQSTVVALFDHFVEWIEERGFSHELFEWAFALMAFLEKPLLPETHSSLRTLIRACIKLRLQLKSVDDEALPPLNYFITIISKNFDQHDLGDN